MTGAVFDSVDTTVTVSGDSYGLLEAELKSNITKTPAESTIKVFDWEDLGAPDFRSEINVSVNEENVYSGIVRNNNYQKNNDVIKIKCSNISSELKSNTYTSTYAKNKESMNSVGIDKEDYPNEKAVSEIVEDVVLEAFDGIEGLTVEDNLKLTIDTDDVIFRSDLDLTETDDLYPANTANKTKFGVGTEYEDFGVTLDIEEESCKSVLDKLANIAGGIWYINDKNQVVFGKPEVSEENQDGTPIEIKYVKEKDNGRVQPPYKGVKVVGGDISRTEVRFEENKVGITTKYVKTYNPTIVEKGEKPRYKYEDPDINTREQAEKVAKNLLSKIKNREQSGSVTGLGNTEKISPYSIVRMPKQLGGYMFMTKFVKHNINNQDGFITKVGLGSLVNEDEL